MQVPDHGWPDKAWQVFLRFGQPGQDEPWLKAEASARTGGGGSPSPKGPVSRAEVKAKNRERATAMTGGSGSKKRARSNPGSTRDSVDLSAGGDNGTEVSSPDKFGDLVGMVSSMKDSMEKNASVVERLVEQLSRADERQARADEAKAQAKEKSVRIEALQAILRVAPVGSDAYNNALASLTELANV